MSAGDPVEFTSPDHFTAGAIGPPGERVFFLQAREGTSVLTLKCEKEQVRALAEFLARLLAGLGSGPEPAPADLELVEPVEPAWDVGALGAGYDETEGRVIVEAREVTVADETDEESGEGETEQEVAPDDEPPPPAADQAVARFRLTRAQAASFVARARAIVAAGRPLCPVCNGPIDPTGHVCARANGHAPGRA